MEKPPILNRADWLFVLFFNLGYPTLRPFRFYEQEWKKFLKATSKSVTDCCKGILETSLNQDLSSVFFA
jgi:hypothetical protein